MELSTSMFFKSTKALLRIFSTSFPGMGGRAVARDIASVLVGIADGVDAPSNVEQLIKLVGACVPEPVPVLSLC